MVDQNEAAYMEKRLALTGGDMTAYIKYLAQMTVCFHVAHVGPTCASGGEPTSGRGRPHSENCANTFSGEVRNYELVAT